MNTELPKSQVDLNDLYLQTMTKLAEVQAKNLIDSVKGGYIPQYLYRYRTFNFIEDIILNNRLYFADPNQFNDPFDCRVNVDIKGSHEDIKSFLKNYNIRNRTDSELDDDARKILSNPQKFSKIVAQAMNKDMSESRICSFSTAWDSMLMWSHYTDGHKGLLLKFDVLADPYFFSSPLIIKYSNTYPTVDFSGGFTGSHEAFLTTKYTNWEYEKEIRVFKKLNMEEGLHMFSFNKKALVGIFFGNRTDDKSMEDIINLSKSLGYNIEFKKMQLKEREFGVYPVDIF